MVKAHYMEQVERLRRNRLKKLVAPYFFYFNIDIGL